jgi:hypothetical protein
MFYAVTGCFQQEIQLQIMSMYIIFRLCLLNCIQPVLWIDYENKYYLPFALFSAFHVYTCPPTADVKASFKLSAWPPPCNVLCIRMLMIQLHRYSLSYILSDHVGSKLRRKITLPSLFSGSKLRRKITLPSLFRCYARAQRAAVPTPPSY